MQLVTMRVSLLVPLRGQPEKRPCSELGLPLRVVSELVQCEVQQEGVGKSLVCPGHSGGALLIGLKRAGTSRQKLLRSAVS